MCEKKINFKNSLHFLKINSSLISNNFVHRINSIHAVLLLNRVLNHCCVLIHELIVKEKNRKRLSKHNFDIFVDYSGNLRNILHYALRKEEEKEKNSKFYIKKKLRTSQYSVIIILKMQRNN